ncbi:SDR family NAD(P)-dependent oxidoreductase [Kitasatospora sp. NPDC048298]|uniref:SDR family NAD(P)-dependent oxidoreductase n=1 Tax=Kitasatospora sp. NPDC048298 TaxID=3364049 RepID=UPI003719DB5E
MAVDVTDAETVRAATKRIERELGTVDLLVNNAGVMLPAPTEELRTDQWQRQIERCRRRLARPAPPSPCETSAEGRT